MTDSIFFDTVCISAFLWVNDESLLEKLYGGNIIIPKQVYDELNKPSISHLKDRIDQLVERGTASIMVIEITSQEFKTYRALVNPSDKYQKVIGKGEAASIALAKQYNGTLGSNNLRDVKKYVDEYNLKHVTTADILVEAFSRKLITDEQGNEIWSEMLKKRRKIGGNSFTEYLQRVEK